MNILAFDPGKKSGIAIKSKGKVRTIPYEFKSLQHLLNTLEPLVTENDIEIIAAGRPTRYPQVIAAHSKMLAMVEFLCEEYELPYHETIDAEAKKEVLGKGNAKKEDIEAWGSKIVGPGKTQDEYDALMFVHYIEARLKKG